MKNIILKFLFLFYRYYDKGSTKSIAYFSALNALIIVLFLNLFSVLIFFDVVKRNPEYSIKTSMVIKYLNGYVIYIPIFLILKKIFRKEDILKIEMDKPSMKRGYFIIITYIILSILILILSIRNK